MEADKCSGLLGTPFADPNVLQYERLGDTSVIKCQVTSLLMYTEKWIIQVSNGMDERSNASAISQV
jgi:hypothetical protein